MTADQLTWWTHAETDGSGYGEQLSEGTKCGGEALLATTTLGLTSRLAGSRSGPRADHSREADKNGVVLRPRPSMARLV
ncbi:hypothetical protein GCM10009741_77040 [Kribbella lupini]|uniref:Uncharacterized protein n=1 Tax=Kribbella lupini TaxID=291602 RepID=A0ABN2CKW0_9ACTN